MSKHKLPILFHIFLSFFSVFADSVKALLGRHTKILIKYMVKLETKGDKTENRVLVSILHSHSRQNESHFDMAFFFLLLLSPSASAEKNKTHKEFVECPLWAWKFDLRSNRSTWLHHRSIRHHRQINSRKQTNDSHCTIVTSFGVFVFSSFSFHENRNGINIHFLNWKTVPSTARYRRMNDKC